MSPSLRRARTAADYASARRLFEAYADWLRVDLCFQNFTRELETLPQMYGPPTGSLLLAQVEGADVGCVGVRDLGGGVCEMKRLWVDPAFQGRGLGRQLAAESLEEARQLGYRLMRLDTLEEMTAARALYQSLGFYPISPYYGNPEQAPTVYLECDLTR